VLETVSAMNQTTAVFGASSRVVVIWIDWYQYHIARFRALVESGSAPGQVRGIALVGGTGVHAGYKFAEHLPGSLPVKTLFPKTNWQNVGAIRLAHGVWKNLAEEKPSLVLVPGYYTLPGIAAAIWGKLNRSTTVLMTESGAQDQQRVWWKEWVKSFLIKSLFDWAVSGGRTHRRYLARLGFPSQRVARFYDVVDNKFYSENTDALRKHATAADFDLPQNYFLYVGRLAAEKNLYALLMAYIRYRVSGGDWSLVFVGDGPEGEQLRAIAERSGYGADIYFEGLKKSAELPAYYAFASCFVLPSTSEPWGLVVNEAMASGLPVIVSQSCGCAEDLVEENGNGMLFDPASDHELAGCLSSLACSSAQKLKAMGERSLEIISRFSPEAWAAEVVRIANTELP
jgi:1,2-diacylglycerol 3-alpha-glucosyltransferase